MEGSARRVARLVAGSSAALALVAAAPASAVPSYSREYAVSCTGCHTMWGSLNVAGATFRLSGYRAMNGKALTPAEKPIELANGALTFPATFPASIITGAGFEYRNEDRKASDGVEITRTGASLVLEDASIFLTGALGKHLSFFMEFPMYETKAWEFTPTGPGEANDKTRGNIQFVAESPAFEVAKFWWNSLLPESMAPRDSVNLLAGITHLPLAYPSGKVRLAVNQYLVYERRALDLISPVRVDDFLGGEAGERLFRLGEPQAMAEVNGMVVPGASVEDVGKRQTFWLEYHLGITNASNGHADGNTQKGVYLRYVMRWYNQSLGVFGFYTGDTYDAEIRALGAGAGVMLGGSARNSTVRVGPDATLSLAPLGVPVNLENNVLYNRESDPTGRGKEFVWWGGLHQLNAIISRTAVCYLRYDWIKGKRFDDAVVVVEPREWDLVAGLQFLILENLKIIGEYRHHAFEDRASTPTKATLTDDGFTLRSMVGF